jgi:hypothetical protein
MNSNPEHKSGSQDDTTEHKNSGTKEYKKIPRI